MTLSATATLQKTLEAQWNFLMQEYPEWATFAGVLGHNDRWTDWSLDSIAKRRRRQEEFLTTLRSLDLNSLEANDRISCELAIYEIEMERRSQDFGSIFMPIDHMSNFQSLLTDTLAAMPTATISDWQNFLARLERFPLFLEQNEVLMREGIKRGLMPFHEYMKAISEQIDMMLTERFEDCPVFDYFLKAPADIQKRALELLKTEIYPSFRQFQKFFDEEYAPAGRKMESWESLPNGKEWYAYTVKKHTTTELTPKAIHEMGIKEVARLNAEMDKIRQELGFKGDAKAFRQHLLEGKEFFYTNANDLMNGYRSVMRHVDEKISSQFAVLPKTPCEVRAMPEFRAKTGPGGQYFSGSLEMNRSGYFEANTFDLPSRPKWEVETLTLHEVSPGHHLQISLAKENKNLPAFRRNVFYTAYGEGWALYAETLGPALGLFKDPYSRYGHLASAVFRAVRLVVDTGLHAFGWSREKALQYFRDNVPTTDHDSLNEINRYVAMPAQALAYKVGELKIQELRRRSEQRLGSRFSVHEFHDQLLKCGCLPLTVLENVINTWSEK